PLILAFQVAYALKLNIPSITLGETIELEVSWTSAAGDPDFMNLFISCDPDFTKFRQVGFSVGTTSMSILLVTPSSLVSQNLNFP
ncbi:hypothetical protein C0991_001930, partial [Blastosporella zonata]